METSEAFGCVLRELRTRKGLSMRGLSAAVCAAGYSMDSAAVCHLERSTRQWHAGHVDAVCAGLGVSAPRFIGMAARKMREAQR